MSSSHKKLLINVSGELCRSKIKELVELVASREKRQVALVCGGGNVIRGGRGEARQMNRLLADQIGMISTLINGLFLYEALLGEGIDTKLFSALSVQNLEPYNPLTARLELEKRILVLVGGIGQGGVSTDTVSVLRAQELDCDVWVKLTKRDRVYYSDPAFDREAQPFPDPTYEKILAHKLAIIDPAAAALGAEKGPGMVLFDGKKMENFWREIDSAYVIN